MANEKSNSGTLSHRLLSFAIPLAGSSILQQLFNAADTAVVGKFVGSLALAAVGANGSMINLLINLFVGLSVGTNVVLSGAIGKGDREKIRHTICSSLWIALFSGILLMLVGLLFARQLLTVINTPEDILEQAVLYLRVYYLGMPFIMLYNFGAAILRSGGDSRRPLYTLTVTGIINVLLNLLFVLVFGLGVLGVALATVLANILNAAAMLYFIIRDNRGLISSADYSKTDKITVGEIAAVGVPAGLQSLVYSFTNILIQWGFNRLGSAAVAAATASLNFEFIVFYVLYAFGQGATTFVSRYRGAGEPEKCVRTYRLSLTYGFLITLTLGVLFTVFRMPLAGLFTSDPETLRLTALRMQYVLIFESVNTIIEVTAGCLRGMGHSLLPTIICMVGISGLRTVWIFTVFLFHETFVILCLTYAVTWFITAAAILIAYRAVRKRDILKV